MDKIKQEAERRYQFISILDSSDRDFNLTQRDLRQSFISGAEYGYQLGLDEALKFAEWVSAMSLYKCNPIFKTWQRKYYENKTTAELFEIFKKEQSQ